MSKDKNRSHYLIGAVIAGVLGTLSLLSRKNYAVREWSDDAMDYASQLIENGMHVNKNTKTRLLGGIAGGLIGTATALLLAPKAGKNLIHDITARFGRGAPLKRSSKKPMMKKSKVKAPKGNMTVKKKAKTSQMKTKKRAGGRTAEKIRHPEHVHDTIVASS